jgi:hypothetical protein
MENDFKYDVFLSHSSKDKSVVRPLAERLREAGLRLWFDEWEIPSEVPLAHRMGEGSEVRAAKIEEGLGRSQFRFQPSAFILQPFLDAPIKGSLAQFLCMNWQAAGQPEQ